MLPHQGSELRQSHPPDATGPRGTTVRHTGPVTTDPTGLSSPLGQLVIAAGLVSALVVLIWQWRRRR